MARNVNIPQIVAELRRLSTETSGILQSASLVAANDVLPVYKKRIFLTGRARTGGKIGKYSTKASYVSIARAKRKFGSQVNTGKLKPRGKNSKSPKFKNGKRRKSRYLPTGYANLRKDVGRQSSYVDLYMTGELERSIQVGKNGNDTVMGFLKDKEYEKAENLEEHFGKPIFNMSEKEIDRALDKAEAEFDKFFNKLFK